MSTKAILQLVLLVVFSVTLSGCTALRARLQNKVNTGTDSMSSTTSETTETYTSVQKVRDAQSDQEAVELTSDEIDAALTESDALDDPETLNTQDVGL